jgi:hypothetical protein
MKAWIKVLVVLMTLGFAYMASQFALFTQQEFRDFIHLDEQFGFRGGWKWEMPAPDGPVTELDEENDEGERFAVSWNLDVPDLLSFNTIVTAAKNNRLYVYLIIGCVLVWVIFRRIRKQKKVEQAVRVHVKRQPEVITREKKHEEVFIEGREVNEPIRLALIQWERSLPVYRRRAHSETVQQWFNRLGCSPEIIPIYEEIRYGKKEARHEAEQLMKAWIDKHQYIVG